MPLSHHPSEYYIRYLMTLDHPQASQDGWILWNIQTLGFPAADLEYIRELRTELLPKIPVNFERTNRLNRESVKFMRSEGIWSMHNPDAPMQEATAILQNPKVREVVEQLLLGRLDPKEVAKKVNARFEEHCTTAGIESYRHCYWNVTLCSIEDWDRILGKANYQTREKAISALTIGPSMALHQTGFAQNIESKTVMKAVQEALYFDFLRWKAEPMSPDKTRALTGIAAGLCKVDEQLQQADSALRDALKSLEQFRMQHAEFQVQSIRDLAPAGNFSLSGAKLLEAKTGS
jgi:hypothetical protein